jgi:hypothetical protein
VQQLQGFDGKMRQKKRYWRLQRNPFTATIFPQCENSGVSFGRKLGRR